MYPEVWLYDPSNDLWEQLPDYPFAKRRWAVKTKIGERCCIGLRTNGTNFNDFQELDQFAALNEFKIDGFKAFPTLADDDLNLYPRMLTIFKFRYSIVWE